MAGNPGDGDLEAIHCPCQVWGHCNSLGRKAFWGLLCGCRRDVSQWPPAGGQGAGPRLPCRGKHDCVFDHSRQAGVRVGCHGLVLGKGTKSSWKPTFWHGEVQLGSPYFSRVLLRAHGAVQAGITPYQSISTDVHRLQLHHPHHHLLRSIPPISPPIGALGW